MKVSEMAEGLVGSEIIKLAGEIKALEAEGQSIYNFTIGDFDANIFPLPKAYKQAITDAYNDNQTNYPPANGMLPLRKAAAKFTKKTCDLDYTADEFLVAGGSRPLIFATYSALVDPNDKVLFPVPSWNNNHYTHLHRANSILIETKPENNFMPSLEDLAPHLSSSSLLALCSPLNPTGTVFSEEQLRPICEAVLVENKKREASNEKPLYILFDQIYQALCHDASHIDPISLVPELRPYCVYIDGLSKAFAATGVRVGYAFGPQPIINKMKAILGHVGAWAPKAEQVASANFLNQENEVDEFLTDFKQQIYLRLNKLHEGFSSLKNEGFPVDSIKPQAAIYLTVKLDLLDSVTGKNNGLKSIADVCAHLLKEAKLAIVPFKAFGASETSPWFRISVGTCKVDELDDVLTGLKTVLSKLK
tara:strand:+ start:130619 stop:131875 length:1257 start_codon:yes stop_codon:yes gene_type:complete